MSTLWTPSGEYAPRDEPEAAGPAPRPEAPRPDEPDETERLTAIRAVHEELRRAPVAEVVANHALGLFELAIVHLGIATPPGPDGRQPAADLPSAKFAIDAMAALVDGLGSRFGEVEAPLRDALTQAQVAYVRVAGAPGEGAPGEP